MQRTIDETTRRRAIKISYNTLHNITPTTVSRTREEILEASSILDIRGKKLNAYVESDEISIVAGPVTSYMTRQQFDMLISSNEKKMKDAARDLDFITAAQFRDELFALKKKYKDKFAYLNN